MSRYTFDPDGDVLFSLRANETSGDIDAHGLGLEKKSTKRKRSSENDEADEEEPNTEESYEMLVSSRHLMLSSSVFKAMLQPHFAEGAALRENGTSGHVTIPLSDDDPFALAVIMTIIHGQLKKVPKSVSVRQLTYIAIVVDKYEWKDAVDYFTPTWIEYWDTLLVEHAFTDGTQPYSNPRHVLQTWLCISWVFKSPNLFKKTTKLAIHYSNGTLSGKPGLGYPENLPIPQAVFDKIERARIHAIKSALSVLSYQIRSYQGNRSSIICSGYKGPSTTFLSREQQLSAKICDCATLGGLIQSAYASKLYPAPSPPFDGWTYARIAAGIKSIGPAVPSYCLELNKTSNGLLGSKVSCHKLDGVFKAGLRKVTEELQGLDLESVLSKP